MAKGNELSQRDRDSYKQDLIDKEGFLYCERCKVSGTRFEVHHLIYRSEKPKHEYLHDKINLINVCVKCHNWFHNNKSNRNQIVRERELNKYFGEDVLDK